MGSNVFGNAITNQTLMDLPEYKDKTIGPRDRATEALHMRSAEGKDLKARNYVESLRKEWEKYVETAHPSFGIADKTCVLVLLYNATGDTFNFLEDYNWAGHIGRAPHPLRIENGQWGAFLHVNSLSGVENLPNQDHYWGSIARASYRGKNEAGQEFDFSFWWANFGPKDMFRQQYEAYVNYASSTELSEELSKPILADTEMPEKPKLNKSWGPSHGIMYKAIMGQAVSPVLEVMVTLEYAG